MSSIASGANAERTNRWLLIGGVALAILAGLLVFIALTNSGGSSSSKSNQAAGDAKVLVAKDTIDPNTKITAGMFEQRSVPQSILVANPVSDETAVIGKSTFGQIIKGQQLSYDNLGINQGDAAKQLAFKIADGQRGLSVPVSAPQLVAGLVVPGDHVDVVVTYQQNRDQSSLTRVETVLQDIRVLAVAQTTVDNQPTLDRNGTPVASDPTKDLGGRPTDAKADPSAGTVTLDLNPDQVQVLVAAMSKGTLTLSLRGVTDDKVLNQPPLFQNDQGRVAGP